MSDPVPDPARASVAISLCTFQRPDVLDALLARLVEVQDRARDVAEVGVVVVDDDPAGSAEDTAKSWSDRFERGLRYHHTGSRNISIARNQALDGGLELGDWLALIDDDCLPDPAWVEQLVVVQRRTGADCVSGFCGTVLPPDAPRWLSDEPFDDDPVEVEDGAPVTDGYLKNTLVSADLLRRTGVRFDVDLGVSSGEDAMFFHDLHASGVAHHFAAQARVDEMVPESRATLRYQLRRRYWYGNTEAVTTIGSGSSSRARVAASGVKTALLGAARPLRRRVGGESAQWRFAVSEVLRGVGRVLGAVGIKVDHR